MTTPAERITACAREWLRIFTGYLEEDPDNWRYGFAIAQRAKQVLCTHSDVRRLYGEIWECHICGGVTD